MAVFIPVLVLMLMVMCLLVFVAVLVSMTVPVSMFMMVGMISVMLVRVGMLVLVVMVVSVPMFRVQVDVELRACDAALFASTHMDVVAACAELFQLVFQGMRVHANIDQSADEHVTADPAEKVQIKSIHSHNHGC